MKQLLSLFLVILFLNVKAQQQRSEENFDKNWLFARYGLQANGTTIVEPEGLEQKDFNDLQWRKLDLPHDWGIEGPFRQDLDGYTGKLPWKGIGWYRKHFTISSSEKNRQL